MSVVHIEKRITRDEQSFEESSSSDKSLLWLSEGANVESFSIDLTVGEQWSEKYGPDSNSMFKISEAGIQLVKHGSIVVTSAEEIQVPQNMYGILVPTGSLFLDKGVLIAPAKVEPAFSGNLKLRLFNTTGYKHNLKVGDKLGSVIFFSTETTRFQKTITKKSNLVSKPIPRCKRIGIFFKRHGAKIFSWTGGSVAAALLVHFVLQPLFPNGTAQNSGGTPTSASSVVPTPASSATPATSPKNTP